MARILTGVQSTGTPHLGNILGAIIPAIEMSNHPKNDSYLFIADMHSLTQIKDAKVLRQNTYATAATWLAFGLDIQKTVFYRQSDVPQVTELSWYLSCFFPFTRLELAHSFKDKADRLEDVNGGLFTYPMLMAADILLYDANIIPVGKDQLQHIEMTRDIAARFNHTYKKIFELPEAIIESEKDIVLGIDGRKMSKSYGNIIPLLSTEKALKKSIAKIVTNSLEPGEPKDTDGCSVFSLYSHFASKNELLELADDYKNGISWGDAKNKLFSLVNNEISPIRDKYEEFSTNDKLLNELLHEGSLKARVLAKEKIAIVRDLIGIKPIS